MFWNRPPEIPIFQKKPHRDLLSHYVDSQCSELSGLLSIRGFSSLLPMTDLDHCIPTTSLLGP